MEISSDFLLECFISADLDWPLYSVWNLIKSFGTLSDENTAVLVWLGFNSPPDKAITVGGKYLASTDYVSCSAKKDEKSLSFYHKYTSNFNPWNTSIWFLKKLFLKWFRKLLFCSYKQAGNQPPTGLLLI